jgi:hypothetical protein
MLIVRKGPTSHLPLHDRRRQRQTDTTEIPPTEILGRIFTTFAGEAGKKGAEAYTSRISQEKLLKNGT